MENEIKAQKKAMDNKMEWDRLLENTINSVLKQNIVFRDDNIIVKLLWKYKQSNC